MEAPASRRGDPASATPTRSTRSTRATRTDPSLSAHLHRPQAVDRRRHLAARRGEPGVYRRVPEVIDCVVRLRLRCRSRSGAIRSKRPRASSRRASRPTSSARRSTRRAAGSTRCSVISTLLFDRADRAAAAIPLQDVHRARATSRDQDGKKESKSKGQLHAARGDPRPRAAGVRGGRRPRQASSQGGHGASRSRARTTRGSTSRASPRSVRDLPRRPARERASRSALRPASAAAARDPPRARGRGRRSA